MLNIQIQEVTLLSTKAETCVTIFQIFVVDRLLSHVILEASKKPLTFITRHFECYRTYIWSVEGSMRVTQRYACKFQIREPIEYCASFNDDSQLN